jgi:phage tail-like protein
MANQSIPMNTFGFKVKVGDEELGLFQEVSGLSVQLNVTDLKEGGVNNTTHKLIDGVSFSNVTLKRGLCSAGSMFGWIAKAINGDVPERRTVTITMLGDDGKPVKTFTLQNALPVKWDGPSLNVMQDSIATESLELAHEKLTIGQ